VIWSLITYKKSLKISRGIIRICESKKNRQHNGQKKKTQLDKQRSTKHTDKTKDRVTRTPLKTGGEIRRS
jgi:hypothetical protein